jgi:hypothetical protein
MQETKIKKTDRNKRYRRVLSASTLAGDSVKNSGGDDLDVDKSVLGSGPGFDKDNWPDVADTGWGATIFKHYGATPYWEDYAREKTLRGGGGV